MSFEIELLGVRGSLPTPYFPPLLESYISELLATFCASPMGKTGNYHSFLEKLPEHLKGGYGGNTMCIRLHNSNQDIVLIDGGTGIRNSLNDLLAAPDKNKNSVIHILMTHYHWDHLMGLPFFTPLFIPGRKIVFHAVHDKYDEYIKAVFKKPFFPVEFKDLASTISFEKLKPRQLNAIGKFEIYPYKLDHPDECWGFKVQCEGRTYSHCVDTEATRVSAKDLGEDLPLYQNVDVMLFDAQYTSKEAQEKVNWGHSAATTGLEIAFRENVKKIILAHHDPWASDDKIASTYMETFNHFDHLHMKKIERNEKLETFCQIAIEGQKIRV